MKKIVSIMVTLVLLAISMTAIVSADTPAGKKLTKDDFKITGENVTLVEDAKGIKASFTDGDIYKMVSSKEAIKLDGLILDISNVVSIAETNPANGINISLAKADGAIDGPSRIKFMVNTYGALADAVDGEDKAIKPAVFESIGLLLNNPRQGAYLYFFKNDDGSFTYYAAGGSTVSGIISKENILKMFGVEDPSVYVIFNNAYWGQTSSSSFIINEISTGTPNQIVKYSDAHGRDIKTTQTGILEGITFEHFGNDGAYAEIARKSKLDGLTIEGLSFDHQSIIRFGSTSGTSFNNGFAGEGLMLQINADGNFYATFLDTPEDSDLIGKFEKNQKYTIHTAKKADGSFVAFVIGEETGEKFKFAITAEYIDLMYADEDPMVHVSFTAYASTKDPDIKMTKIDKVTNKKFEAVAPNKVTATISERVLTAGVGTADPAMTYSYQWFSNTTNANTAGTKIDGANAATYSIPVGLKAGKHYYYCVVTAESYSGKEESVASNTVEFIVKADEKAPAGKPTDTGNARSIEIFAVAVFAALCITILLTAGKKKKS